jgi:uncharacterized coiled-coil protein SlyX
MTIVAAGGLVSSELAGEAVILDLKSGMCYGLDKAEARIWELMQNPKTINEIRDTLLAEYQGEVERCEQALQALIQELQAKELVKIKG